MRSAATVPEIVGNGGGTIEMFLHIHKSPPVASSAKNDWFRESSLSAPNPNCESRHADDVGDFLP
jgi:hypothetical protein